MLAFLGGFSSATSMVIVAAIALATMVSNHIVLPLWLCVAPGPARWSRATCARWCWPRGGCRSRAVLALGYLYYRLSGGGAALAAIGLISFAGVAQVLPALLGGIFWRGATRIGAAAGLVTGFAGLGLLPVPAELRRRRSCPPRCWPGAAAASAGCARRRCSGSGGSTRSCTRCSGAWRSTPLVFLAARSSSFPHAAGAAAGRADSSMSSAAATAARGWSRGRRPRPRTCWSWRSASSAPAEAQALFQREAAAQGQARLPARPDARLPRAAGARAGGLGRRGDGARDGGADRRAAARSRSRT